jgi:hypothetical protein
MAVSEILDTTHEQPGVASVEETGPIHETEPDRESSGGVERPSTPEGEEREDPSDAGSDSIVEAELVAAPQESEEAAEARRLGFPHVEQYREVTGEAKAAGYEDVAEFAHDLNVRGQGLSAIEQIDTYLHQLHDRSDLPGDHQTELVQAYIAERQRLANAVVESDTKVRDGYIGSLKADGIGISPAMEDILRRTALSELRVTVNEIRKAAGRGPAATPARTSGGGSTPAVRQSPSVEAAAPAPESWKRNVRSSYEDLFSKSGVYKG